MTNYSASCLSQAALLVGIPSALSAVSGALAIKHENKTMPFANIGQYLWVSIACKFPTPPFARAIERDPMGLIAPLD